LENIELIVMNKQLQRPSNKHELLFHEIKKYHPSIAQIIETQDADFYSIIFNLGQSDDSATIVSQIKQQKKKHFFKRKTKA